MTFRGETVTMPELVALVEKHRGCHGNGEASADDGEAWDEGGSPVGKIEVERGPQERKPSMPADSAGKIAQAGGPDVAIVGNGQTGTSQPKCSPSLPAANYPDECAPVDVVLLAQSSVLLCKAMAFILLDFNAGVELREAIIEHLDVTRRTMQATGRQLVYDSVFQADGAATA